MPEREWSFYLDDMIDFAESPASAVHRSSPGKVRTMSAESSGIPALFPLPWFYVWLPAVEKFGILAWREAE